MAESKTILVLGGGVGGVATARALRKHLPSAHRVILVDRERDHVFAPSLLWLMVGRRIADAITRPLVRQARKAANIAHAISGQVQLARFDGHGDCFIESGGGKAGFGAATSTRSRSQR
jgi:NADH dehydrogenase FAD-containing subunit